MAKRSFKSFQTRKRSFSRVLILLICFAVLPLFQASVSYADITRITNDADKDLYPDWSPDGAKIAFASNRSGNWDIWLINPDGTGLTNLTNTPGTDEKFPSWSPDSQYIAYSKYDPSLENNWGGYQLCIKKADGSASEEILRLPKEIPFSDPQNPQYQYYWEDPFFIGNPVWSPDGTQILFQSYGPAGGNLKLYRYTLSSQEVVEVTPSQDEINSLGDIYRSDWSGDVITYDRYPIGIQTFVPDANNPSPQGNSQYKVLIPSPPQHIGTPVEPAWSPDGTKLAFTRGAFYEPDNTLVIYDRSKGLMIPLDQVVTNASWPSWNPDGTKIALVHDRNGNSDIWVASLPELPTNARVSGTYVVYDLERGFHGGEAQAWGVNTEQTLSKTVITFHADGTYNATFDEVSQNRFIGEDGNGNNTFLTTHDSDSGTETGNYIVSEDGTLTLLWMENNKPQQITGVLGNEGNTIIFGETAFDYQGRFASSGFGVGVKQGTGFTVASFTGTYRIHEFESGFHGGNDNAWGASDELLLTGVDLTFDGAGGFTMDVEDKSVYRNIGNTGSAGHNSFLTTEETETGSGTGTYTVSPDGTITLNLSDGPLSVYASPDGEMIIFGESEFDSNDTSCDLGIGVGIRKGTGFTAADLKGTFQVGEFEAGFNANWPPGGWGYHDVQTLSTSLITFDGAGHYTSEYTGSELSRDIQEADQNGTYLNTFHTWETPDNGTENGTYTVSPDGTVTLSFVEDGKPETSTAYLSADGNVVSFMEHGYDASAFDAYHDIGIGIKKTIFPRLLQPGDVNGDRSVTLTDAILSLKTVSDQQSAGIYSGGDVNGDGKIGAAEAVYILQSVAGLR